MSTTLLFAELLIIGIQAGLWLSLLLLNIVGLAWLPNIQFAMMAEWQTLVVILLLSFLYVVGIIVDRVADTIFSKWEYRIAKEGFPNEKSHWSFSGLRRAKTMNISTINMNTTAQG